MKYQEKDLLNHQKVINNFQNSKKKIKKMKNKKKIINFLWVKIKFTTFIKFFKNNKNFKLNILRLNYIEDLIIMKKNKKK